MITKTTGKEILIRIDSIDQLFNAPDINPFSDKEVDVLGEAALQRATRHLLARDIRHRHGLRLIIVLPADQINPDLTSKTAEAVQRYCLAKIEDNKLEIRLSHMRGLVGMALALAIGLLVIGVVYLLMQGPFSDTSDLVKSIVAGVVCVFGWVILWDPVEKLLFEWISPFLENRILRSIMGMEVIVEAQA